MNTFNNVTLLAGLFMFQASITGTNAHAQQLDNDKTARTELAESFTAANDDETPKSASYLATGALRADTTGRYVAVVATIGVDGMAGFRAVEKKIVEKMASKGVTMEFFINEAPGNGALFSYIQKDQSRYSGVFASTDLTLENFAASLPLIVDRVNKELKARRNKDNQPVPTAYMSGH